ncbi:hypothetical protein C1646_766264 [Rhizophagus diaphanus]|nr:hypothetical protein C1646_766264 [Rhizophagus diaphanus] [Rhizophagus sp. MUCL 43196]
MSLVFEFVHFESEIERDDFFNYIKERSFTGLHGKTLNFNRAKAKNVHYKDDDITSVIAHAIGNLTVTNFAVTNLAVTNLAVAVAVAVANLTVAVANLTVAVANLTVAVRNLANLTVAVANFTNFAVTNLTVAVAVTNLAVANPNASQTSPVTPQYNIFELSNELIVYIQAIAIEKNSIEIEVNNFEASHIYVKFKYSQDIETGLQCKKRSFHIPEDEIKILIHLLKMFDLEKDMKVELLCGIIKISLDGEDPFHLVLPDDLNEDSSQVVPLSPNTLRTSPSTSSQTNFIQKYSKYLSRNISSNIKQNTTNTSSSKISQTPLSIPKIHLPKSVADLPKLSRQPLDETERDLKVENEKLKAHVEEKENDDLYKKLEKYKNLCKPSIIEEGKGTRKHARSDEYENEYKERMSNNE